MVRKSESIFRERFAKQLKKIPNSFFESCQQKSIRGTPDIMGCVNGHFVALELKASKKDKLMPLQKYKRHQIIDIAKGRHYTPTPENAEEILIELNKLARE